MAKSKVFGPQYPMSIEREYLRYLNAYAKEYIRLLRAGMEDILPDMKETAAKEQPRIDSSWASKTPKQVLRDADIIIRQLQRRERMDESFDEKLTKLFKKIDQNMTVKFSNDVLKRIVKAMVGKSSKYSKQQLKKMVATAKDKEGEDIDIEPLLTDKGMNPYFQNVIEMNVSLIRSIPKYSEPRMKETLIAMLTKDATIKDIREVLLKNFNLTKGRAAFIARDQVGKLNGALEQHRQQQLGLNRYIWRTSEDQRVREDHERLDGKIFYWSKPPIVDRKTGRRGNPKEDYQCRCWAEPILDDIIET